ncbi:MAG: hypothetical protein IT384_06325 [Deltaproteobacteria bacterium]|nr:hypothetical protein [Deltaproteobacteria bacterium]
MVFGVFTATGCVQPAPIARELDASAREDGGSSSDATSARDGGSLADAAPSADASPDAGAGADAVFTGWAQVINDGVQAVGSAVAADAQGNVYVAGRIDGDTDFGGGVRQTTGSFYLASYAADGRYRWDALLGFTSQFIEQNLVLTVDSGGRPVVAGTYTELGREDAFVVTYDPTSGQRVGLRQFGGSGDDELNAIAADDSGHVFVTGSVRGNVDVFGTSHSVQSNADVYVARLAVAPDASDWYRIYATTMTEAHGEAIAFRDGVVHFAGGFGGTITVGSSSFSGDFGDTFLGKVTPDGASASAIPLSSGGGGGLLELSAMAVSAEGTRYLIGRFRGGLTVGTTSLASIRSYDVFLCAVASNDMVSWAHGYGQPSAGGLGGIDWGQALAIDAQGDLLIAGAMNGGLDLGGRTLEIAIGDGEDVMFVASISAAGMTRWAIRGGSDYEDDIAHSVAALSDGSVLVAGTISGLGGLAGVVLPFNGGLRSGFVARFAP